MKFYYGLFLVYLIYPKQTEVLGAIVKRETTEFDDSLPANAIAIRKNVQERLFAHPERAEISNVISDNIESLAHEGKRAVGDLGVSATSAIYKLMRARSSCEEDSGGFFEFMQSTASCFQGFYTKSWKIMDQLTHDIGTAIGSSDVVGTRYEACIWNPFCYMTMELPSNQEYDKLKEEVYQLYKESRNQFLDVVKLELVNVVICFVAKMGSSTVDNC